MVTLSISEFKATCLAVLERVRVTGEPILITRHGQPIAEVVPPRLTEQPHRGFLGRLRGTAKIAGDITESTLTDEDFGKGTLESWDWTQR